MAFSLAFSQAPPDHPFVGEFFPVQLTLIDGDHEIHGGIELPLSLELYYEEKDKQVSKGVFEVEGSKSPKITKNGMCTCKLHITKSSMELDNRRFVLKASAKMKNGSKLEVWSDIDDPAKRGPSAPVPSIVDENWAGVYISAGSIA